MKFSLIFLSFSVLSGCFLVAEIKDTDSEASKSQSISIGVNATSLSFTESNSTQVFTSSLELALNRVADFPILVNLGSVDGYALLGQDYQLEVSTISIPPGTLTVSLPISILGDSIGEGDENFKLTLGTSSTEVIFINSEINITIIDDDPITLNVGPLFPVNGVNFFNFVINQSENKIPEISDLPCSLLPIPSYDKCIDGGYYRKVVAVGQHSCADLTMTDDLGLFEWSCSTSEDPVFFYSEKVRKGQSLKDFLNPSSFKVNFVTLNKLSDTVASSSPAAWWVNTVSPVVLNSGGSDPRLILNGSEVIYTISGGGISRGISIESPRTGLVVLSGVLTSAASTVGDCESDTAPQNQCLVEMGNNSDQFYLEGNFLGTANLDSVISIDGTFGINVYMGTINNSIVTGVGVGSGVDSRSTNVGGLTIENTRVDGFQVGIMMLSLGAYKLLKNVEVSNCTFTGISESINAWHSKYIGIKAINNGGDGLTGLPFYSHVQDFVGVNNGSAGLSGWNQASIYKNLFLAGNGTGAEITPSTGVVSNLTAFNNTFDGLAFSSVNDPIGVSNIFLVNNGTGLRIFDEGYPFSNLWISDNNVGIEFLNSSTGSSFQSKLYLGNTTNCLFTSVGTNPGLAGVNCDNQGPSAAIRTLGVSAVGFLQGKVTSELVNPHTLGISIASAILEWFSFENSFRFWANENVGDFFSATKGPCLGGANCRVWDGRLKEPATGVFNANGVFMANVPCPLSVQGDVTDFYTADAEPFLRYATEILFDRTGNDNGLCESDEECIYSPHIGAYQGEGDYRSNTCIFQNGIGSQAVTNVKMYAYPL